MKFKFLEHTADIKFKAYGSNINEVFENAALAFFEAITDTKKVKPKVKKEFSLEAQDKESLLYDFLEELLVLHEASNYLFSKFKVEVNNHSLKAEVWGEKIKDSHELRNLVKAVTYHDMIVKEEMAQVVLDI